MELFVALDAGTGSAKCCVFDANGRLVARASEPWSYDIRDDPELPNVKHFSFDPQAFWSALARCVQRSLQAVGAAPGRVAGVAATSQREACVFVDASGREVYAGPNLDARGFREGLEVLNELGAEQLYRITGHSAPFIFPLARYLWFRKQHGNAVAHLLMMNDWITWRLSGTMVAEPSNATESMLFDFRARQWSAAILERFAIPASILPPVVPPGARVGAVSAEAAHVTGLLPGTPVYAGGADTQCSLLGAGAVEPGEVGITLGTTTPVQLVTGEPLLDPQGALWAGCHVLRNRWVLESNAGDTGDAHRWVIGLLTGGAADQATCQQLERAAWECGKSDVLHYIGPAIFDLHRIALQRPGGILFPFPTLHVRPTAAEILRGFYESLGFALRANAEQLQTVWGKTPARWVLSGGMTHNTVLVRIVTNVLGTATHVATERESTALGCALLMMAEGNEERLRTLARSVPAHEGFTPDPQTADRYAERFAVWRRLHEQMFDMVI